MRYILRQKKNQISAQVFQIQALDALKRECVEFLQIPRILNADN